jgi:hypothetical protein
MLAKYSNIRKSSDKAVSASHTSMKMLRVRRSLLRHPVIMSSPEISFLEITKTTKN